jgi:TonB family protein
MEPRRLLVTRSIRVRSVLIALVAFTGCSTPQEPAPTDGEQPVLIRAAEARAHLTSAPEPVYPLFAKAAGVAGAVHYEIDISTDGRVSAARLIHGSPMLEQTARDAVVQWRFSPFRIDGRAVPARTIVTLTFQGRPVPSGTVSALDRFADAMLWCADDARRSAFEEAAVHCASAMAVATELASFDRTSDARPTRLYAEALAALGRHEEAVPPFESVVARLRQVPVFSLDRALAQRGLGHSLAAIGREEDALRAYRQADQQLSEALDGAARNSTFRAETVENLRAFLPRYALLLDTVGRTADAEQVRSRLDTIR